MFSLRTRSSAIFDLSGEGVSSREGWFLQIHRIHRVLRASNVLASRYCNKLSQSSTKEGDISTCSSDPYYYSINETRILLYIYIYQYCSDFGRSNTLFVSGGRLLVPVAPPPAEQTMKIKILSTKHNQQNKEIDAHYHNVRYY